MRFLSLSLLIFFGSFTAAYSCDQQAVDCLFISSIQVMGTDNIIICNSCAVDVPLTGGVMVVDSDPDNSEILADTSVPALGCITLVEDEDFDFGFSAGNGDGFTLTCADGTVVLNKSFGPTDDPIIFCAPQPVTCDAGSAASVFISKVIYDGPGDDQIILCNDSPFPVTITGAIISDSNSSEMLVNATVIPPLGCVALVRNIDFTFGLGDDETVTIECGSVIIDTVTYDQDGQDLECFIAAPTPLGPCGAGAAAIFISSVNNDTEEVVVCNNSATPVSLDGATLSDASNTETVFGVSIPAFGCVTLIQDIHFTFGLGEEDEFTIACGGTTIDSVAFGPIDGETVFQMPPVTPQIPTMGEWGLICLTLLLMIFGVVRVKEESTVTLA